MRSQANTARLMEQNPTLMRLREIEALEKVAKKGRLSVVVGEGGKGPTAAHEENRHVIDQNRQLMRNTDNDAPGPSLSGNAYGSLSSRPSQEA